MTFMLQLVSADWRFIFVVVSQETRLSLSLVIAVLVIAVSMRGVLVQVNLRSAYRLHRPAQRLSLHQPMYFAFLVIGL